MKTDGSKAKDTEKIMKPEDLKSEDLKYWEKIKTRERELVTVVINDVVSAIYDNIKCCKCGCKTFRREIYHPPKVVEICSNCNFVKGVIN